MTKHVFFTNLKENVSSLFTFRKCGSLSMKCICSHEEHQQNGGDSEPLLARRAVASHCIWGFICFHTDVQRGAVLLTRRVKGDNSPPQVRNRRVPFNHDGRLPADREVRCFSLKIIRIKAPMVFKVKYSVYSINAVVFKSAQIIISDFLKH